MGRRALLTCLSNRTAKGWTRAGKDLQNVCLVNIGFLNIFHWKLEVRGGWGEWWRIWRRVCALGLPTMKGRPRNVGPHLMLLRVASEKALA